LVVFTSDNGGLSHDRRSMSPPHTHNSPLSSGKGAHHEGGIRVPLIIRWPNVTAEASTCDTPIIIHDWFPTLLEIAGAEIPATMDGLDLTPLLRGQVETWPDRALIWHFPNFWGPLSLEEPVPGPGLGPSSTIRRGDWKLIYYHGDQSFELFNLAMDLGETKNLVDSEPDRAGKLAEELTRVLRRHQAPMPIVKATGQPVPMPSEALGL